MVQKTISNRRNLKTKEKTYTHTSIYSLNIPYFKFIYLFIYLWLRWVFVAARGLSLVAASGGYSPLQCAGFSLQWLLLLRSTGFRCAGFSSCGSRALERRLSSCSVQASLLHSMWALPRPGLEPCVPCTGRRILNHCTTREALKIYF